MNRMNFVKNAMLVSASMAFVIPLSCHFTNAQNVVKLIGMQKLAYKWSKRHKDYLIHFPAKCDGHLLYGFFENESAKKFLAELEARGYDLTTLKFEVKLKS